MGPRKGDEHKRWTIHYRYTHDLPSVGIEPTTLGLLDPRSNQLSYEGGVDRLQTSI